MTSQPFFSIITCTYNSGKFVQQALDSVCQQTFQDYEHIIVDGNSTDNTKSLIEQYQKNYPDKVRILYQVPAGIAAAMNAGNQAAQGKMLSFLNSDDAYASNNVLDLVYKAFQQFPDKQWYLGDQDYIDETGKITEHATTPEYSYAWLKRTSYIPHQAAFLSKAVLDQVGGFANYKYGMDYDSWLKIGLQHSPIQTHDTVALFRRHQDSATTKSHRQALIELYQIRQKLPRTVWIQFKDFVNLIAGLLGY